jgi:hypothetical protein
MFPLHHTTTMIEKGEQRDHDRREGKEGREFKERKNRDKKEKE